MVSFEKRDQELESQLIGTLKEVMRTGVYVGGRMVEDFEEQFGDFLGGKFVVGVGNGLDALRLGLLSLGVGPGDEVIVPGMTFVATHLAVHQVGAIPISVDVDLSSGQINVDSVIEGITEKTRAIIAVHLYGHEAPIKDLYSLARDRGLFLIEDAAQAHGLRASGASLGTYSDLAAFSFYPTKNLGAFGDAGAVATSNADLAQRVRVLSNYGANPESRYEYQAPGWNSRLDPIQAGVLSVFLPHLSDWNQARAQNAALYLEVLGNDPNSRSEITPVLHRNSVWHHFVVRTPHRARFRDFFLKRGVETSIHYPVLASQAVGLVVDVREPVTPTPNSEQIASQAVSIPVHPWLGRDAEVVANTLEAWTNCHQ